MPPGSATVAPLIKPPLREKRAQPAAAPDLFQACLQGRLVGHLKAEAAPEAGIPPAAGSRLGFLPGGAPRFRRRGGFEESGGAGAWVLMPLPLRPATQTAANLPAASPSRGWPASLSGSRPGAGRLVGPHGRPGLVTAGAQVPAATGPEAAVPAPLQELLAIMARHPDGGLKLPRERLPEVASLLLDAGLPAPRLERLLTHPGLSESGLTPRELLAALRPGPVVGQRLSPPVPARELPDAGGRGWDRLRLPSEALPEVKLALHKLGVPPEALAAWEDEAAAAGVPLKQVWELLREAQASRLSADTPQATASALADELAGGGPQEAEIWRQLLAKAGLPPEIVDALWGGADPASPGELRAKLLSLAPPQEPPAVQETPKPVYLPSRLRLSGWDWPTRQEPDAAGEQAAFRPQPGAAPAPPPGAPEGSMNSWLPPAAPEAPGHPGAPGESLAALPPGWRQAVWDQVQQAIITNLKPGHSRLSLNLNPPELGRVSLTLNLEGHHLLVTAVAARPEVAHLARAQVNQLVQALSQQGLLLSHFQVQVEEGAPGLPPSLTLPTSRAGGRKAPSLAAGVTARPGVAAGVDFFA